MLRVTIKTTAPVPQVLTALKVINLMLLNQYY